MPKNLPVQRIGDKDILSNFEDAVIDGLSWKEARVAVGNRNGLLDVGGHPVNAWARGLLARGYRRFRKANLDDLLGCI